MGRGVVHSAETPEGSGHATGKIRVDQKVLGHSHLSIKMLYTHVVDGKPEDAMKGLYGPLVDRGEEKNGCESYRIADPLSYSTSAFINQKGPRDKPPRAWLETLL